MGLAGGNGSDALASERLDALGGPLAARVAMPEPAAVARAERVHAAAVHQRKAVPARRGHAHLRDHAHAADRLDARGVSSELRPPAMAELAHRAVTEGEKRAIACRDEAVEGSRSNGGHRRSRQGLNLRRQLLVLLVSMAELSAKAGAEREDGATSGKDEAVLLPGSDGHDPRARQRLDLPRQPNLLFVSVAELAPFSVAEGVDLPVAGEGQRVHGVRGDGDDAPGEGDGRHQKRQLACQVCSFALSQQATAVHVRAARE
eukprot:CAMPEP_0175394010 /NCGR_PEP_ID=MMETSP0095-20121207/33221_1 /TAXON_ID=311494 /ORGANISM="Alexandrium monilatum, Strain CCMP3105" /LENGTH=259 /DNA_ID=CAMNT_0016692613 /DNA_START=255 /DNA_END=1032 /DNA_ORIENTATION=-